MKRRVDRRGLCNENESEGWGYAYFQDRIQRPCSSVPWLRFSVGNDPPHAWVSKMWNSVLFLPWSLSHMTGLCNSMSLRTTYRWCTCSLSKQLHQTSSEHSTCNWLWLCQVGHVPGSYFIFGHRTTINLPFPFSIQERVLLGKITVTITMCRIMSCTMRK